MRLYRHLLVSLATAAAVAVVPACGSDAELPSDDDGSGVEPPVEPPPDNPRDGFGTDGDAGADGGGDDTACSETSEKAELLPLDMYIMLDRSRSMGWTFDSRQAASGGFRSPDARWGAIILALKEFLGDPKSEGIGVGLQYFSLGEGDVMCDPATYKAPAIGIQPLPTHEAQLKASLDATELKSGTPTRPALRGALEHAKDWSDQHPGHNVVVVLATDGEPSGCSSNVGNVSAAAAEYATDHGIKTYVIGIGPEVMNMDAIAAAGGTGTAFSVAGATAAQDFVAAMNEIRTVAIACEYKIPMPEGGGTIDYGKVNLRFTAGDGTQTNVPYVGGEGQCGSGGWYYDDPTKPTLIRVCPETCDQFKADDKGEASVVFSCKGRGPA